MHASPEFHSAGLSSISVLRGESHTQPSRSEPSPQRGEKQALARSADCRHSPRQLIFTACLPLRLARWASVSPTPPLPSWGLLPTEGMALKESHRYHSYS